MLVLAAVMFVNLTLPTCRYCYECINKATGARHCLVCGDQEGTNLIHCTSCPRAYHTNCINPNMSKVRERDSDLPASNFPDVN